MNLINLKIDKEFKELIRPLKTKEFLQLESNILSDGCRDPIITWNGYIVDGHNRYEICHRHNIPFSVHEMEFDCKEAVIAWICANQLGRRNISDETRKFLIGMQYQTEKIAASKRNARGVNQYSNTDYIETPQDNMDRQISLRTAERIAEENHISHATVQKYAMYSKALDAIQDKEPNMAKKILSGHYKISHKNVMELAKRPPEELKRLNRNIDRNPVPYVQYKKTRSAINKGKNNVSYDNDSAKPSVKDMPQYDPDAEISSLTLTVPSWTSSMQRSEKVMDLEKTSTKARFEFINAVESLIKQSEHMLSLVKEVNSDE